MVRCSFDLNTLTGTSRVFDLAEAVKLTEIFGDVLLREMSVTNALGLINPSSMREFGFAPAMLQYNYQMGICRPVVVFDTMDILFTVTIRNCHFRYIKASGYLQNRFVLVQTTFIPYSHTPNKWFYLDNLFDDIHQQDSMGLLSLQNSCFMKGNSFFNLNTNATLVENESIVVTMGPTGGIFRNRIVDFKDFASVGDRIENFTSPLGLGLFYMSSQYKVGEIVFEGLKIVNGFGSSGSFGFNFALFTTVTFRACEFRNIEHNYLNTLLYIVNVLPLLIVDNCTFSAISNTRSSMAQIFQSFGPQDVTNSVFENFDN